MSPILKRVEELFSGLSSARTADDQAYKDVFTACPENSSSTRPSVSNG